MTTVKRFPRQNDAGLRALNVFLGENLVLVVVLVLESEGPYLHDGRKKVAFGKSFEVHHLRCVYFLYSVHMQKVVLSASERTHAIFISFRDLSRCFLMTLLSMPVYFEVLDRLPDWLAGISPLFHSVNR